MLTKKKWAIFSLLTLCGGTIYKLPSLKDAFYIPMQDYFHLTNGQIGNAMSVNSVVTTIGFFLSIYFADKLPRRYTMSLSLIATGLLGIYLTTMPGYWGILFVWALFGVTCDMMNWPVLLKSVSRLGNSEQQGRLFGFFETGRGIVDTIIAFSALAIFTWFGSGLLGFKAGIWFYALIVIVVGIMLFFMLKEKDEDAPEKATVDSATEKSSISSVLKDKTIWLIAFNVFFVYAVYCGLTFFIPFIKNRDGSYKITNSKTGKVLSPGGDAQDWYICGESGAYYLKSKNADQVLTVADDSENVQMNDWNGTAAQKFQIRKQAVSGDLNSDSILTVTDAVLLQRYILGEKTLTQTQRQAADLNADGVVNGFDLALLRQKLVV